MPRPNRTPWREQGSDPDYRFSLANERTFLAWVRTGLALLAGSLAVVQFVDPFAVRGARMLLALLLAGLGLLVVVSSYPRWAAVERSMRYRQRLPHTPMFVVISVALAAAAVLIIAAAIEAGG